MAGWCPPRSSKPLCPWATWDRRVRFPCSPATFTNVIAGADAAPRDARAWARYRQRLTGLRCLAAQVALPGPLGSPPGARTEPAAGTTAIEGGVAAPASAHPVGRDLLPQAPVQVAGLAHAAPDGACGAVAAERAGHPSEHITSRDGRRAPRRHRGGGAVPRDVGTAETVVARACRRTRRTPVALGEGATDAPEALAGR